MNANGIALVCYGEPGPLYHMRVLLAHAGSDDWAILTPDHDIYIETMSPTNADFTDFFYAGETGNIPAHINPANVYAFTPLTPAELGAFRVQGEVIAQAQLRALGLPPHGPVGAAAAVAAAPVAVAPAPHPGHLGAAGVAAAPAAGAVGVEPVDTWVALEDGGQYKRGDVISRGPNPVPVGSQVIGERGVTPIAGGSILMKKVKGSEVPSYRMEDLRILPVHFDSQGVRRLEFPAAIALMDGTEPMGGGLQLTGPSTTLRLLKDLRDQAFTPGTFHEHWLRTNDIPRGDRSIYEHEVLSRILESAIVVDQLNAPSLQSIELMCRRLQVIREAHRISPTQPDYSSADLFMGWKYRKSGQGIDQTLAQHVAGELKAEAAIAKESRKAREEQQARRKNRPKKAGDGGADG